MRRDGLRRGDRPINLLPARLADVYPTEWDRSVWNAIDRQIEVREASVARRRAGSPALRRLALGKA